MPPVDCLEGTLDRTSLLALAFMIVNDGYTGVGEPMLLMMFFLCLFYVFPICW